MPRAPLLRAGRRTVVLAAAVSAGVLLIVVLVAGWASGGHSNVTYVDGSDSAVLYAAGHRPLGVAGATQPVVDPIQDPVLGVGHGLVDADGEVDVVHDSPSVQTRLVSRR